MVQRIMVNTDNVALFHRFNSIIPSSVSQHSVCNLSTYIVQDYIDENNIPLCCVCFTWCSFCKTTYRCDVADCNVNSYPIMQSKANDKNALCTHHHS